MNGRRGASRKHSNGRIEGGFAALPFAVLDSAAFQALGYPARALLLELARQYRGDNNGRLIATSALLEPRGWRSHDVISRALIELEAAQLVHRTVRGGRPNRANWWALTWYALDRHPGYDPGSYETFRRGAFHRGEPMRKNAALIPPRGPRPPPIDPAGGAEPLSPTPSRGAIAGVFNASPIPSAGGHIEQPSAAVPAALH